MLKKRIGAEEFENKVIFMLMGYDLFPQEISGFNTDNMMPIKEFYNTYKNQILDKWRKQDRPAERPWAWWRLEAGLSQEESMEYFRHYKDPRAYLEQSGLLEPWETVKLAEWDKAKHDTRPLSDEGEAL